MDSISAKDLRSHKMFPMMGKLKGPGGRRWLLVEENTRLKRALRRAAVEMVMRIRNQVSIFLEVVRRGQFRCRQDYIEKVSRLLDLLVQLWVIVINNKI